MKDPLLRLACFLIGYNYEILKKSSEASVQTVKKYFAALLIVSILWFLIGFTFTQRYLDGKTFGSILGAFIMAFIVILIERQIILTMKKRKSIYGFRIFIGFLMAILGSVILDQIIFKDDIEKKQIVNIQTEVNKALPIKTQELSLQIQQLENSIQIKENERANALIDIGKNPTIYIPSSTQGYVMDSVSGKMVLINKTVTNNSIPNPKGEMIPNIDAQIKHLRDQKISKENKKLNIQEVLENDLESKIGFLDELNVLFSILLSSVVAFLVWLIIFLFLFAIEFLVVVNKIGDSKTDYEETILYQLNMRIKMLEKLTEDHQVKNQFSVV